MYVRPAGCDEQLKPAGRHFSHNMKTNPVLSFLLLLVIWVISIFMLHVPTVIQLLISLAVLIALRKLLYWAAATSLTAKITLELKYYWYVKILKKAGRESGKSYARNEKR